MQIRWASPIMDNAWLILKFTRKWTTVAKVRNSDGGEDEVSFNPTTAQYVRLKCINRATGYGISIWEMQVLPH